MKINSEKQIIFFELNEVPSIIFHRYANKKKSFAKLLNNFSEYKTYSYDEVHLSPWITWPTVHKGVTFVKHKIENLGQDIKESNKSYPPIWETLKELKLSIGVYGSLHSSYQNNKLSDYKFYIPDIYSSGSKCYPRNLQSIQNFQLNLSRKSARNVDKNIGGISSFKVIFTLLKNGLSIAVIFKILKQLFNEKIFKHLLTRRRVILTDINFDIFKYLLRKNNPNFCTFYSNHVASSMHRYWEASFPNDYDSQTQSKKWIKRYKGEIDYAMQSTEKIMRELLNYSKTRPNCEIWICTSMGQGPIQNYEAISSQLILNDKDKFLGYFDLDSKKYKIKPTMMPRFTFESNDKSNIKLLKKKLKNLQLNGKEIQQMSVGETLTIKLEHFNTEPNFTYNGFSINKDLLGMKMLEIEDNSGSSAYHVPEGCLFISGKDSNRYSNNEIIATHDIKKLIMDTYKEN